LTVLEYFLKRKVHADQIGGVELMD